MEFLMDNTLKPSSVNNYLGYALYLAISYALTLPIMIYGDGAFAEYLSRVILLFLVLAISPAHRFFKNWLVQLACVVPAGAAGALLAMHIAYEIKGYPIALPDDNVALTAVLFYVMFVSLLASWIALKATGQCDEKSS